MSAERVARAVLLSVLGVAVGCDLRNEQGPALPRPIGHPPGTAFTIDGRPVLAADIDAIARPIAQRHPEYTTFQHRRMALVSLVIDREVLGTAFAPGRAAAWEAAEREREQLATGAGDCQPRTVFGGENELGLATWAGLLEAPPEVWTGPFEEVGSTVIARRVSNAAARRAIGERVPLEPVSNAFGIEACAWNWAPGLDREHVERALDTSRLEITDPTYRDLIPLRLRQRLGAEAP